MTIAALLITTALLVQPQQRVLHIEVAGDLTPDQRAGLELALVETSQTANLFGTRVSLSGDSRSMIGRIVANRSVISQSHLPVVHLTTGSRGPSQRGCEFRMRAREDDVVWQPTLTRYGASELNERFTKRFGRPMTSGAWTAWFAIKMLVETALRESDATKLCEAMSRGRFDGHKGQPLSFDPDTRVLRQPLYTR